MLSPFNRCAERVIKTKDIKPVLHPDIFWYRLNGKGVQKNVLKKDLVTLKIYNHWGFEVSLNYSIRNLKKTVYAQKTSGCSSEKL